MRRAIVICRIIIDRLDRVNWRHSYYHGTYDKAAEVRDPKSDTSDMLIFFDCMSWH